MGHPACVQGPPLRNLKLAAPASCDVIMHVEKWYGAAGQWLSNPQAVMYGVDQTGAVTTVLLTLSSPTVPQQPAGTVTNNNSEICLLQCHLQMLLNLLHVM